MDMQTVIQVISNVGFPIAATAALYMQLAKEQENHKEEMNALKDVIQANTVALVELKEKLNDKL